jgi:GNAT superfamily N-acetyltransferase
VAKISTVRPLQETDHAPWLALWAGYIAACIEQGIAAPPPECTDLNWSRLLSNEEAVFGLLAEIGERPVGLVHYIFHRSTFHAESICYLQDLYTASDFRGQGVASSLIQAVSEAATVSGAKRVYWQTAQSNEEAIALYERVAIRTRTLSYRLRP